MRGKRAILIIDGWQFESTYRNKQSAEETLTRSRQYAANQSRSIKYELRSYYVNIKTVNPKTMETIEWDKEEGFSIWQK